MEIVVLDVLTVKILHVDPKNYDSCGWFLRAENGNDEVLRSIITTFNSHWDKYLTSWFDKEGKYRYQPVKILISMFDIAVLEHF